MSYSLMPVDFPIQKSDSQEKNKTWTVKTTLRTFHEKQVSPVTAYPTMCMSSTDFSLWCIVTVKKLNDYVKRKKQHPKPSKGQEQYPQGKPQGQTGMTTK